MKYLSFISVGKNKKECRLCDISPLLFSIYMRSIGSLLPHKFKYTMFADDLAFSGFEDTQVSAKMMSATLIRLFSLLSNMGLKVVPTKTFYCVFPISNTDFSDSKIELLSTLIGCYVLNT